MPIADRSQNLLEQLRLRGIGKKPLVFIGHSLGGIVIKQMLQDASTLQNEEWRQLGNRTKGVVFLATPHSGSDYASFFNGLNELTLHAVRVSLTTRELQSNGVLLRKLNVWYRNNVSDLGITTCVLYETQPPPPLAHVIVDASSSDPGISGITPIAISANHTTICKVNSKDNLVYKTVLDFITKNLVPDRPHDEMSFAQFVTAFDQVREDATALEAFKRDHVEHKVGWTAFIKTVLPDKNDPAYMISAEVDMPVRDQALARFSASNFKESIKPNTKVELEGVISEATNLNGAILYDCRILKMIELPSAKTTGESTAVSNPN